jgi:hydroxymethylpyrimidine pyrophosphatase-like HAD family hydrolase
VVDDRHRFYPAKSAITEQIVRLLRLGVIVGFATGRGKSIRQDLRKVIPTELWGLITIGYYNGAEISSLSDDVTPDGDSPPCQDLQKALDSLNKNLEISSLANITARKYQLTVEPKHMVPENLMFELAQDELNYSAYVSGNIFRSSHSIDILAQGVSKVSVVDEISNQLAPELNILTIGDRGRWPGNDSRLLKHVYSLSVEEVSPCQNSGWNLCPPGIRGPQGTLYYLSNLQAVLSSDPAVKLVCGEPL